MPSFFISRFNESISSKEIQDLTLDPFSLEYPAELLRKATIHLQNRLNTIDHNFGLDSSKKGRPIGKMFGVLIVKDQEEKIGYLSAFSGKLNNGNHYEGFVPPVYDGLQEGGFLNKGMTELSEIVQKVRALELQQNPTLALQIKALKDQRKNHSKALQKKLFQSYHFLNSNKESKSLLDIFENQQPQGGSGECAAPKLLQFAFNNDLIPMAITEFWWGVSPKSLHRIHGEHYPSCEEKCRPILGWMLG